jgi:hypothetical protein
MKGSAVFLVVFASILLQYVSADNMLDRVNVDNYLKNPKVVEFHIRCLVYNGPCDKIGSEIKRLLPMVGRQCRGCTDDQKAKLGKIIGYWQKNYPQAWQDMLKKMRNY